MASPDSSHKRQKTKGIEETKTESLVHPGLSRRRDRPALHRAGEKELGDRFQSAPGPWAGETVLVS